MIRIYWNNNSHEATNGQTLSSDNITVQRLEGGSWYSEETSTGLRTTFQLLDRTSLSGGMVIESLKQVHDDFIEQPCWLDDSLESWRLLRTENGTALWEIDHHHLMISFPIEQPLCSWVESLLGPVAYKEMQEELYSNKKEGLLRRVLQRRQTAQESRNSTHPEKPGQQESTQTAKSPLQKRMQLQPSDGKTHADLREMSQASPSKPSVNRAQQPSLQPPVSGAPRAVQSGSLCSPSLLPELPLPRKSPFHPPKHHIHTSLIHQGRPKVNACLIDLSQS